MSEGIESEKASKQDHEQFWRMAIETWQASGLSIRQFCKNEGLSEPQFYSWRKKLAGDSTEHDEKNEPGPPSFIEVAIPKDNHAAVELLLTSGSTLKIPAGIDAKTLTTIISVLHQTNLC